MRKGEGQRHYGSDFVAWTQAQAAELRAMAERRVNTALDLVNLAEEVEELGKSERDAVRSQVRRIIEPALKLEHARAVWPRNGWKGSIVNARNILADKLTPTLRGDLEARLPQLYEQARDEAELALLQHGEGEAARMLPQEPPYRLDDLLARGWYPRSRHGIDDLTAG
jgi:hypothetical protein